MEKYPEKIADYEIHGIIGAGGMGIVYRGMDPQSGQELAIKTVRLANEGLLSSIRREILALTQIEHPGVVPVIDNGIYDGFPWYAMKLLLGTPLTHIINRATSSPGKTKKEISSPGSGVHSMVTQPVTDHYVNEFSPQTVPSPSLYQIIPIGQTIDIMYAVFETLAFLHGEGFVHSDLKPDNIIIENSIPIVVDFGLVSISSRADSRDILQIRKSGVGTLSYMAPEHFRGGNIDARSDIYSLGCIFYELITGLRPFGRDSFTATMNAHMTETPLLPSQLNPEVPLWLDELIMNLLKKDPLARIAYAEDVISILEQHRNHDLLPRPRPSPRSYLYRPSFIGHKKHLHFGCSHLDTMMNGTGFPLIIRGESGIGKTRLALELAKYATNGGLLMMTGQCQQDCFVPFESLLPFLQQLGDRCLSRGKSETEAIFGETIRLFEPFEHSLRHVPGFDDYQEPEQLSPQESTFRLLHAFVHVIKNVTHICPLLLILDDFQWADELTISLIQFFERNKIFESTPVALILTVREEEIPERIRVLIETDSFHHVLLERLDRHTVEAMIRDMLIMPVVPVPFSEYLTNQSEGNPFFVAEYIRMAVAQSLLYRSPQRKWRISMELIRAIEQGNSNTMPLPDSIQSLINGRIEKLSPSLIDLAEAAAVIGRTFNSAILGTMKKVPEAELAKLLKELMLVHIIEEHSATLYHFVHEKLRDTLMKRLSATRYQKLHRDAATAIEQLYSENLPQHYGILAFYWEAAKDHKKSKEYYKRAFEHALVQYSPAQAEIFMHGFYRLTPEDDINDDDLSVMIKYFGYILPRLGKLDHALEESHRIIALTRKLQLKKHEVNAMIAQSSIFAAKGKPDKAIEICEEALKLVHESGVNIDLTHYYSVLSSHYYTGGFVKKACDILEKNMAIQLKNHSFAELRSSQLKLAVYYRELGKIEKSTNLFLDILDEKNEKYLNPLLGDTLLNYAGTLFYSGKSDKAIEYYTRAIEHFEKSGSLHFLAYAHHDIANLYSFIGRSGESRFHAEKAVEIFRSAGAAIGEGASLIIIAESEILSGNINNASKIVDSALHIFQINRGSDRVKLFTLLTKSKLLRYKGEIENANICNNEAALIAEQLDDPVSRINVESDKLKIIIATQKYDDLLLNKIFDLLNSLSLPQDSFLWQQYALLEKSHSYSKSGQFKHIIGGELKSSLEPQILAYLEQKKSPYPQS